MEARKWRVLDYFTFVAFLLEEVCGFHYGLHVNPVSCNDQNLIGLGHKLPPLREKPVG